jgi:hypothetical protein
MDTSRRLESQSTMVPDPEVGGLKVRVDKQGRLVSQVFCRHCRYPFAGIPAGAEVCPECGFSAAESVQQYLRFWVSEKWVAAQIRVQMWLMAVFGAFIVWGPVASIVGAPKGKGGPEAWFAMPAWVALGVVVGMVLILKVRRLMEVPAGFGGAEGKAGEGSLSVLEYAGHAGLAMTACAWAVLGVLGRAQEAQVCAWVLAALMVAGVSWHQFAWARMIKRGLAVLSTRPVGPYYWMAYVPAAVLLVGGLGLRPWVAELNMFHTWWGDIALVTLFVWMWIMIAVPLMVLASAWVRLTSLFNEAVWTRMQGREQGTAPEGYAGGKVEVAFEQSRRAKMFGKVHARLSERNAGMPLVVEVRGGKP